jgi:hypothetical protein
MPASSVSVFLAVAVAAGLVGSLTLRGSAQGSGHARVRVEGEDLALARACSGMASDQRTDATLFIVRAQSDGSDPVCDAARNPETGDLAVAARAAADADLAIASSLRPGQVHTSTLERVGANRR